MSEALTELARCANCQTPLSDAFCAHCGQKVKPLNPTLRELAGDVLGEVTDVDNRFFRTVRYLFTRPGFLSLEHAEGRRARYVSPVRLYLLFSIAFFTASSLVAQREAMFSTDDVVELSTDPSGRKLDPIQASEQGQNAFDTWLPRIMFVLVPLCGVCVMAFTRRTGRHYPEHFHFGLHVHAFWFGLFALTAPLEWLDNKMLSNTMSLVRLGILLVYCVLAFRVAYGGGWWLSIGRATGTIATYMLAVGLTLSAIIGGVIAAITSASE